jgi:hypothetical protein
MTASSWVSFLSLKESYDDTAVYDDSLDSEYFINSILLADGQGIQNAMHSGLRHIFGKVEILYTDIFRDVTTVLTVASSGQYTRSTQLVNSRIEPAQKWFSLHDNKLDGSFHPLPNAADTQEIGWWGTQLSDAEGLLTASTNWVNITFSTRSFTSARIVGDSKLNIYPVDFTVYCYGAGDVLLATLPVEGNTMVDWSGVFEPVLAVERVRIEFSKINKPGMVLKLLEVSIAIREVYDGEMLQNFSYLSEIGYATGALPMGNISANEIDVSILNQDQRFDLKNTNSVLYGQVKRNRQVTPWLGTEVNGVVEWYQLGKFWTTSWDIPKGTLFTEVTARDRLELLRNSNFETSQVYIDYSLYQLFDLVLTDAGVYAEGYYLDPALQDVIIPYAWFDKMNHRNALAKLASCAIIQIYCDSKGDINVDLNLPTTPDIKAAYYDSTNIFTANYPTAVTEQVNAIEVNCMSATVKAPDVIYSAEAPIAIPANSTVVHEIIFRSNSCHEVQAPVVTVTGSITVTDVVTYCWGARITFTNTGAAGTVNTLEVTGKSVTLSQATVALAQDEVLIREDGMVKTTVSSDFIQNATYAGTLATHLLEIFKTSRFDISMTNRGNITVNLGDRIEVDIQGSKEEYSVTRQQLTFVGYLEAKTEARKL